MGAGIVRGAMAAAALAGRYAPARRMLMRPLVTAVVGGLPPGYRARLAYGCNIRADFSGMVSGSLHARTWLAAALAGKCNRHPAGRLFGLKVEPIRQIVR
ncbi:YeeE/YedE family protein [Burkholderia sp. Ac-20365]|nr:YeeE/YedE family protein [Burkholderia sp. Ac-20365]